MADVKMEVADSDAARAACALKPMSTAPLATILAVHFEKGPVEIRPDHEANYWLPERHWWLVDDEESSSIGEGEFDGWIAESAE